MRKFIALAAITIIVGLSQAASAHERVASAHKQAASSHESERLCRDAQGSERLSNEQFRSKVDQLGYSIDRMKYEHGCIEARLTERSNGGKVKALFNATTGELLRARPAS